MTKKVKVKVMIGTPAHDGKVDVWYAHSLVETMKRFTKTNVKLHPIFVAYDSLVQRARNDLVKIAIESGMDYLLFIDADQAWNPEDVVKLISHNVDVVGGAVVKKSDVEQYNIKSYGPLEVNPETNLAIVDSVGTGFLLVSRRALITAWENWGQPYVNNGVECRMVFDVKVIDGQLTSEDVVFCTKLKENGIPTYLDTSITCSHVGPKKWDGDFWKWYQSNKDRLFPTQG